MNKQEEDEFKKDMMERIQSHPFAEWARENAPIVKELNRLGIKMEKRVNAAEDLIRKEIEAIDANVANEDPYRHLTKIPKLLRLRKEMTEIVKEIVVNERKFFDLVNKRFEYGKEQGDDDG